MTDYNFYRNVYIGDAIPEADFPRLIKRAGDKLRQYRCIYTVHTAVDSEDEKMALCAMAEALYNAEIVASDSVQSASIGSVSTSYGNAMAQAVDITPAGVERALFRAAKMYLYIYRGIC